MIDVTFADIRAAHDRIRPHVHRTPVVTSHMLDRMAGAQLFLKCENLQRIGAFKARGAHNAVLALDGAAASRGVVTHSSGNHGAALALAARSRGIPATIVVPDNAPAAKIENIRRLGGIVQFCAPTIAAREAACAGIVAETGATLVHPYDDRHVIAGQGTIAIELIEDAGPLDAIVAPVGGGGLMSGIAIATAALSPDTRILATEPAGADDAWRSWSTGILTPGDPPATIADGLRGTLSRRTFGILGAHLHGFATVEDDAIVRAMRLVFEVAKMVIEPSAAVALAAVLEGRLDVGRGRVGIVLTGGNVDLDSLPWNRSAAA